MSDSDLDLERRLRAHFRDVRTADAAPLALRADVLAIPRTSDANRTRLGRRRGLTLLAAMVALGIGAAGLALLAGGRTEERPRPSPPAVAILPSPSSTPSPSGDSAPTAAPSGSPDGSGPATIDVTEPGIAAGWKAAGTLSEARILPSATLLQDGRVLVVGGISSDGTAVATAELWDPLTRTFSPAGSLARPRIGHAATLLQDGRVLIVGGEDGVVVAARDAGRGLESGHVPVRGCRLDAPAAVGPVGHDAARRTRPDRWPGCLCRAARGRTRLRPLPRPAGRR